jgi:hypothetical protein
MTRDPIPVPNSIHFVRPVLGGGANTGRDGGNRPGYGSHADYGVAGRSGDSPTDSSASEDERHMGNGGVPVPWWANPGGGAGGNGGVGHEGIQPENGVQQHGSEYSGGGEGAPRDTRGQLTTNGQGAAMLQGRNGNVQGNGIPLGPGDGRGNRGGTEYWYWGHNWHVFLVNRISRLT